MIYATIVFYIYRSNPGIKDRLNGFSTLWGQLLSVTTFTLTFFVNQSYALWRKCLELSRRLQGRLHDIGLNLATHAARKTPTEENEMATYTDSSRQILELMSRYVRLFNLLCYASITRSHRPILTPRGMRRLAERGLMTAKEREALMDAAIPATQRHSAILMWMIRLFVEGRRSGHILGGSGFEQQTMEKFHVIRAQYGGIGDELQGRMPLAYAHIVQVLVDLILWMYPVQAFGSGMSPVLVIVGTGLLTISYQGLFDLAKQFLDPYDNENYGKGEDPLSVDTLIAETNAGSVRWLLGFEEMPFNAERLQDGEMYDYLLPVRGYTVEEVAIMEEEKLQKEAEKEKKRQRKEEERLKEEDQLEEASDAERGHGVEGDNELNEGNANEMNETQVEHNLVVSTIGNETTTYAIEMNKSASIADEKPVHKVTTLAGGKPVSWKPEEEEGVYIRQPVPHVVPNYLASLARPENIQGSQTAAQEADLIVPNELLEGPPSSDEVYNKLPSFDEVGSDLTFEEYKNKIAKIEEAVEMLNASPGFKGKKQVFLVTEKKEKPKSDPTDSEKVEQAESINDETSRKETIDTSESAKGEVTADLQGPAVDDEEENVFSQNEDDSLEKGNSTSSEPSGQSGDESDTIEARLKKIPTEEEFQEEVSKIIAAAEEELLETEAILNSKSGLDPVGWDYEEEDLAPMTNATDIEGIEDRNATDIEGIEDRNASIECALLEEECGDMDEDDCGYKALEVLEVDVDDENESDIEVAVEPDSDDSVAEGTVDSSFEDPLVQMAADFSSNQTIFGGMDPNTTISDRIATMINYNRSAFGDKDRKPRQIMDGDTHDSSEGTFSEVDNALDEEDKKNAEEDDDDATEDFKASDIIEPIFIEDLQNEEGGLLGEDSGTSETDEKDEKSGPLEVPDDTSQTKKD